MPLSKRQRHERYEALLTRIAVNRQEWPRALTHCSRERSSPGNWLRWMRSGFRTVLLLRTLFSALKSMRLLVKPGRLLTVLLAGVGIWRVQSQAKRTLPDREASSRADAQPIAPASSFSQS